MAKIGRPTIYDPAYCEQLIEHMAEGLSFESFAGAIGVSKQTLYDWLEANPAFLDAKKEGFEQSRLTWEKIGNNLAKTGTGNAVAFIFNMKNRFREDWNDKQQIEHSGPAVKININPQEGCEPIKD